MSVAATLAISSVTAAAIPSSSLFHLGSLGPLPIQRRYAEWHGVEDDDIRRLLGWVTICGFLGAHEFDMVAYDWHRIGEVVTTDPPSWWFLPDALFPTHWPLPFRLWDGISSYGGFIGGALGFAFYTWWKRKPKLFFADVTVIGLIPAFSIGRIGCTVVSDHVGAAVDPSKWYAALAVDYDRNFSHLADHYPNLTGATIRAWNLGLIELLYLIPVNALLLWLAFRPSKRLPAGLVAVTAGLLYAPVRFFLDFLRPEDTDPRYFELTFAQWASILAFAAAGAVALKILRHGKPVEPLTRTSGEMQRKLRALLDADPTKAKPEPAPAKREPLPEAKAMPGKTAAKEPEAPTSNAADDDGDGSNDDEARPAAATPAKKPGGQPAPKSNKRKR
jgi:phosphatidylglycerol---prolipoprotein diacylglyceryl transferase